MRRLCARNVGSPLLAVIDGNPGVAAALQVRWRTKTQASLPSEEAVLLLLFGLLRSGQVTLRRLAG